MIGRRDDFLGGRAFIEKRNHRALVHVPILGLGDVDGQEREMRVVLPLREPALSAWGPKFANFRGIAGDLRRARDGDINVVVRIRLRHVDLGVLTDNPDLRAMLAGEEPDDAAVDDLLRRHRPRSQMTLLVFGCEHPHFERFDHRGELRKAWPMGV